MICIATFYSHFGAIRFKKSCEQVGVRGRLMPVPRDLSSSCGTCVRYESSSFCPLAEIPKEVEQIVEIEEPGYKLYFRAEDS